MAKSVSDRIAKLVHHADPKRDERDLLVWVTYMAMAAGVLSRRRRGWYLQDENEIRQDIARNVRRSDAIEPLSTEAVETIVQCVAGKYAFKTYTTPYRTHVDLPDLRYRLAALERLAHHENPEEAKEWMIIISNEEAKQTLGQIPL